MDSKWFLKRRGEKNHPFSAEKQEKTESCAKKKSRMYMPIWRFDLRKGTFPMKKKTIWALATALLALLATGCAAQTNGQTTIVTSFYPMYVLTLNVTDGIDGVTVQNMVEQNVGCLHDYQLQTRDMVTLEGADALVSKLLEMLDRGKKQVRLEIPYSDAGIVDLLKREAAVLSMEYTDTGITAEAIVTPDVLGRVKKYIPGYVEPKEDWE